MMRSIIAVVVMLSFTAAHAKKAKPAPPPVVTPAPTPPPEPTKDPGKEHKLAGIITADIGVGLLVGGVIMLGVATTVNDDISKRRALETAGGLFTGIGATGVLIGAIIWAVSLRETKDWKAAQKAFLVTPTVGRDGGGVALQVRF